MQVYRESVQEFRITGPIPLTIRVWREIGDGKPVAVKHDDDLSSLIMQMTGGYAYPSFDEMAERLLELERVNAVEVKDKAGTGCVFYRYQTVNDADGFAVKVI